MKNCIVTVASFALLIVLSDQAYADSFGSGDNTFDIEFVTIGDPGNIADTTGEPNPAGSVDYVYRMGKFEISRDIVTKANAQGNLDITLDPLTLPPFVIVGGPRPEMPAIGVSWNEAARFVNWLNTTEGFTPAYKFSTQPGDAGYDANANILLWEPGDTGFNPTNQYRNNLAQYFLPSNDEWYKSAYYDPNANGGSGGYWDFPTGSDTAPTAVESGTDAGTAVYAQIQNPGPPPPWPGPADIMQAGGLSPYGTMAQGGNIDEWTETCGSSLLGPLPCADDPTFAFITRGGNFLTAPVGLSSSFILSSGPAAERLGFRVAKIPEPSSQLLGLLGMLGLLTRRRRSS